MDIEQELQEFTETKAKFFSRAGKNQNFGTKQV